MSDQQPSAPDDQPTAVLDDQSAETGQGQPAAATGRRRRRRWLWLSVAVAVLIAGGVGGWLWLRPASQAQPMAMSRTVEVTKGTQTQTVSVSGTLSPRTSSEVNFAVTGTITEVDVKAGDTVDKGDKLAAVDDTDLTNAVSVAEANLTSARANYTEVVDSDASSAAITSASAQVSSAKASLASAKQDLANAVLRSPISGTVAAVNAEEGDSVSSSSSSGASSSKSSSGSGSGSSSSSSSSSSSALFSVISTSTWKVEGTVGSADLGTLKAGQSVAVTPAGATKSIEGKVASVGVVATSTSDDGTATFPVVINISGTHKDLYSGTTASAVITTGSFDDVLTVPTAAIRTENGKTVVTKVTGQTTSTVEVEVGKVFGSNTQVTSGLAEGDSVQITFSRPSGTSSSGSEQGGGFGGGGGLGGGGLGGGNGGGQPPGGGSGGGPGGSGGGGNR